MQFNSRIWLYILIILSKEIHCVIPIIGGAITAASATSKISVASNMAAGAISTMSSASSFLGTSLSSASQKSFTVDIEIFDTDLVSGVSDVYWRLFSTSTTDNTRATVEAASTIIRNKFTTVAIIDDNGQDHEIVMKYKEEVNKFVKQWQFKIRYVDSSGLMQVDICFDNICKLVFSVADGGTRIKMSRRTGSIGTLWEFYVIGSCDLDNNSPDKCILNGHIRPKTRSIELSSNIESVTGKIVTIADSTNDYIIDLGFNTVTSLQYNLVTDLIQYDYFYKNTGNLYWLIKYEWRPLTSDYKLTLTYTLDSQIIYIDPWSRTSERKVVGDCFAVIKSIPDSYQRGKLVTRILCP